MKSDRSSSLPSQENEIVERSIQKVFSNEKKKKCERYIVDEMIQEHSEFIDNKLLNKLKRA